MTIEKEKLKKAFASVRFWERKQGESHLAGINMEGPFLDPAKKGAHREECIMAPDVDFFRECNAACGNKIRLVTLSPDRDGSISFIKALRDEVVISLGHTSADYDTAKAAFEAGASHVTHLFNAMQPFAHRAPGLIGAAAECGECMAELICDGIHVHESMVRAAFKLFPGRIVLISDSMRAAGLENGSYDLGGQSVTVNGSLATLSDGTIAGSVTNLFEGMKKAVCFGIPLEDAVTAATENPARSIGIYDLVGSLTPGKRADVILLDKDLNLVRVIS
jgi:N-acetylglucosamine-6-phosphate deacetylase